MNDVPEIQEDSSSDSEIQHPTPNTPVLFTRPFLNVVVCGVVMCLVYTAFFPGSAIQDIVIEDSSGMNSKVGYFSQGMIYISSIFIAILAPFIISILGMRCCLVASTLLYLGLFMGMIFLKTWSVYLGSIITGLGMGMIWVVSPKIVTDNSTEQNLQRNQSIFWCIYMSSMVLGSLANYFYLADLKKIEYSTSIVMYIVCCVIIIMGAICGFFGYKENLMTFENYENLLSTRSIQVYEEMESESLTVFGHIKDVIKRGKVILFRKEVGYLLIMLVLNGVSLSFYTMTFGTCIGNLHETFPERNIIPLMGIIFGSVEVFGSLVFEKVTAVIGNKRTTVVLFLIAMSAFYLTFLMFPADATKRVIIDEKSYLTPNTLLVLVVSALIALYDAGFNILAMTYTARLFLSDSEMGFMLANSTMSITTGIFFLISSSISLYWVLIAELVMCFASTLVILLNLVVPDDL